MLRSLYRDCKPAVNPPFPADTTTTTPHLTRRLTSTQRGPSPQANHRGSKSYPSLMLTPWTKRRFPYSFHCWIWSMASRTQLTYLTPDNFSKGVPHVHRQELSCVAAGTRARKQIPPSIGFRSEARWIVWRDGVIGEIAQAI